MAMIVDREVAGFWPVEAFQNAYQSEGFILGCACLMDGGNTADPDETAVVLLRTCIEQGERVKSGQKYVVGIRFYSYGDLVTVDVVSHNRKMHKDIAYHHARNLGWQIYDSEGDGDLFTETYGVPLMYSGGFVTLSPTGVAEFSGSSGDYGAPLMGVNVNDIATFAAQACGISVPGACLNGAVFFQSLLDFLLAHKCRPDFYEEFVTDLLRKQGEMRRKAAAAGTALTDPQQVTGQHYSGLLTMKAHDRAIAEDGDLVRLIIEEVSVGFGRHVLLAGVAERLR